MENSAAATLFGVVSERNSAVAAQAAALFKNRRAGDEIVLRTPRQLSLLDDHTIQEYLGAADAVLVAGIFGEDATRVGRLATAIPPMARFLA
ncbi:MAG: hypothetical protein AAGL66_19835, partial [Pseudomonadota bacterium]